MVLYEAMNGYRQIFLDGRPLPKDPNPTWMGYSVGHWEKDVLVVESSEFNDKTWLDELGHPHTEAMHLTERFRRKDFGHLTIEITIDDPKAYTKPWSAAETSNLLSDDELMEYIYAENEKDLKHLP